MSTATSSRRARVRTDAETPAPLDSRHLRLAALFFVLSGFAALLYQVIWQRILAIFSGMHIYSIAMIVTAFMAGLGFGSLLGGRIADRLARSRAVFAFGLCELIIGLFALVSPWLYYDLAYLRLGFLVRQTAAMPVIHLTLLIVPTFLMGASLPLLSRGLVRETRGAARTIGVLYGMNALGSALGAFITVWVLIGALGFVGAIRLGSLLNLLVAAGAFWIARSMAREAPAARMAPAAPVDGAARPDPAAAAIRPLNLPVWAGLYALSGFIALSLELLWFRVLDVFIKSSPYTFGHLLGIYLLFLALGSIVGSLVVHRSRRPDRVFLLGQWGITVWSAVSLLFLLHLPTDGAVLRGIHEFWGSDAGVEISEIAAAWRRLGQGGEATLPLLRAGQVYGLLPLWLLAVPTFLMGLTFAFIQKAVQTRPEHVGWRVGAIQTSNIAGSILGSLLTGTLLFTLLGTAASFRLLIVAGSAFGVLAALRSGARRRRGLAVGAVAVSALLASGIPPSDRFWARFHGSPTSAVVLAEDASSIVALQQQGPRRAILRVNGTGHSFLPHMAGHFLLGCVPVLVHPHPEQVLVIGLGTGTTAWGVGVSPTLQRLDCYEIARPEYTVIERYQDRWFECASLAQYLQDPRMHHRFSDGRLALRLEDRKYDVVEADALEPSMAYSGNLYSKEFFELCLSGLKPGGMVCTYVPTERTRLTALAAFPYALDFHAQGAPSFILGSLEPIRFDRQACLDRLDSPAVHAYLGRSHEGESCRQLLKHYLDQVSVQEISGARRDSLLAGRRDFNRDLFPRDEYDKSYVADYW